MDDTSRTAGETNYFEAMARAMKGTPTVNQRFGASAVHETTASQPFTEESYAREKQTKFLKNQLGELVETDTFLVALRLFGTMSGRWPDIGDSAVWSTHDGAEEIELAYIGGDEGNTVDFWQMTNRESGKVYIFNPEKSELVRVRSDEEFNFPTNKDLNHFMNLVVDLRGENQSKISDRHNARNSIRGARRGEL